MIQPGKKYTRAQLVRALGPQDAQQLRMRGYVLRHDVLDGTYSVVPWTEASDSRTQPVQGAGTFAPPPPIRKRTPAQRVDSLMLKWLDEMKRAGGLPPLREPDRSDPEAWDKYLADKRAMDDKIREIVGAAWVDGRTEITAEVVEKVARHFLEAAEKQHDEKLDHQVTRHED